MDTKETLVGKTCAINHSRKGKFTMHVTADDDEWLTGTIVDGRARAMLPENEREIGEDITVRRSLIRSIEVID